MMIKKLFTMTLVSLVTLTSCAKNSNDATAEVEQDGGTQGATVYFTKDISAASLVKIYEALGVVTSGKRVAVKISTGESSRSNYLRPELIKDLVQKVGGTIVECNTAYGGKKLLTNAASLDGLTKGTYIINGEKRVLE